MSKKEKLIQKLQGKGSFNINDLDTLLGLLGYSKFSKGKTSGSALKYRCEGRNSIYIHKPHPGNEIKEYQRKQIVDVLEQEELV